MNNKTVVWLQIADAHKKDLLPLFPADFDELSKVCFIRPVRTIRDINDKPTVFFVNRQDLIQRLKQQSGLITLDEAKKELMNVFDTNS